MSDTSYRWDVMWAPLLSARQRWKIAYRQMRIAARAHLATSGIRPKRAP